MPIGRDTAFHNTLDPYQLVTSMATVRKCMLIIVLCSYGCGAASPTLVQALVHPCIHVLLLSCCDVALCAVDSRLRLQYTVCIDRYAHIYIYMYIYIYVYIYIYILIHCRPFYVCLLCARMCFHLCSYICVFGLPYVSFVFPLCRSAPLPVLLRINVSVHSALACRSALPIECMQGRRV